MGTRNLTMVISNEQTKVAQYGQWDGYPEGQGATILKFLLSLKNDYTKFKEKIDKLRWITDEEAKVIDKLSYEKLETEYPSLNRDTCGDILELIYNGSFKKDKWPNGVVEIKEDVKFLVDSTSFAADSLFCEWCYVVDLDKQTFEVYTGFNHKPLDVNERFINLTNQTEIDEQTTKSFNGNSYYPVGHVKTYSLNDLPSVETFIEEITELTKEPEGA